METENKVLATTEFLTKAFSSIYDDIFSKRSTLSEISKASEILHGINDAIEAVGEFSYGKRTVYLVSRIKELCNTIPDKDENKLSILRFLDRVLEMTIISESVFFIYGEVAEHFRAVIDME